MAAWLSLSGWAQPADAVSAALGLQAEAFDYSDYGGFEEAMNALAPFSQVPNIVAWSTGGLLAVRAIEAGVLKPEKLTLIATPYQFVKNADFSGGMDPFTYQQFRDNYAANAARTKGRFHALVAKGDVHARRVLEQLQHHPQVENTARWLPWLEALGAYRHRKQNELLDNVGVQLVHGKQDAVADFAQAQAWKGAYPHMQLHAWDEAGHAPHLHDAARLRKLLHSHHGVSPT